MSDDFDDNDSKGKGDKPKETAFDQEQKRGPVVPANEELFNFLDELFTGDGEFPERIDVFVAKGRNRDQVGPMVKQFPFKDSTTKPSRERIVTICNEICRRTRIYTDVLKRETTYMVGALNHARGEDHYDLLPLTVKPSGKYKRGENGDLSLDDEDDQLQPHARANLQLFAEQIKLFGLLGGMLEGLIDRSDRQAAAAMANADRAYARTVELLESNIALVRADAEMEERREKARMWRENVGKGIDLAWKVLPPMLTSFKKGDTSGWTPGVETPEASTIREYFKTDAEGGPLTRDQFQILFGNLENGRIVTPGILSFEQGKLLADVASYALNPDMLDLLLPGGVLELRQEQFEKVLRSGIPIEVFMPLKALLDVRLAKRQQKQSPEPTQ